MLKKKIRTALGLKKKKSHYCFDQPVPLSFLCATIMSVSQLCWKQSLNFLLSSESGQPICGNGMVEAGEQCDCGYSDQCKDRCCHSANEPDGIKCKLKLETKCRYVLRVERPLQLSWMFMRSSNPLLRVLAADKSNSLSSYKWKLRVLTKPRDVVAHN